LIDRLLYFCFGAHRITFSFLDVPFRAFPSPPANLFFNRLNIDATRALTLRCVLGFSLSEISPGIRVESVHATRTFRPTKSFIPGVYWRFPSALLFLSRRPTPLGLRLQVYILPMSPLSPFFGFPSFSLCPPLLGPGCRCRRNAFAWPVTHTTLSCGLFFVVSSPVDLWQPSFPVVFRCHLAVHLPRNPRRAGPCPPFFLIRPHDPQRTLPVAFSAYHEPGNNSDSQPS